MHTRSRGIAVLTLALSAGSLHAQCPDGTPGPPCRQVATGPRRDPPLDERTWLVLPFENSSRLQEAELIAQASVTILTQELGRWQDIRVVPDDRVSDLLRLLPEAERRSPGLEAARRLARSVGAGRVLVGNYIALGSRANLTAKAYDTKTGTQIRAASDRLSGYATDAGLDSLAAVFGRLGRAVLNMKGGREDAVGAVGTSSAAAYREYGQAMAFFNRSRSDSAVTYYRRALAIDSTFGLAHLYLGVSLIALGDSLPGIAEMDAAARFVEAMSPRARLMLAYWRGTPASRCGTADDLLRADSTDAWGWISRGRCLMREELETSSAGPRLSRNRNAAIRAFTRALELDPNSLFAFQALSSAWNPHALGVCAVRVSVVGGFCPNDSYFQGHPTIEGDSIVERLFRYSDHWFQHPGMTRAAADARRVMRIKVRELAERWSAANPEQWYGHWVYAYALLGLGDLVAAERELRASKVAAQIPNARRNYYRDRIELELRAERVREAAFYVDSMFQDRTAQSQPFYQTMFGRFSLDRGNAARASVEDRAAYMSLYAGLVPRDIDASIQRMVEAEVSRSGLEARESQKLNMLTLATILGFHARGTGPALDTASVSPLLRYQSFLARGDTVRARRALAQYDELVNDSADDMFDGGQLFAAESHLELRDTAAAFRHMQVFVVRWPRTHFNANTTTPASYGSGTQPLRLAGRAWLLYADLANARGLRDEARRGYRMVVGLWERGEPSVQPAVTRAREALARLGS